MEKKVFCKRCGKPTKDFDNYSDCINCGYKMFKHPAPAGQVMIIKDAKCLLGIRAKNPKKGTLDLIGGFMEYGEHPEDCAIREAKEEAGIDVKLLNLLGVYIDEYEYQNEIVKILNMVYVGEIISGELKENDDVEKLIWVDIEKDNPQFGFQLATDAFVDLKKWHKSKNEKETF